MATIKDLYKKYGQPIASKVGNFASNFGSKVILTEKSPIVQANNTPQKLFNNITKFSPLRPENNPFLDKQGYQANQRIQNEFNKTLKSGNIISAFTGGYKKNIPTETLNQASGYQGKMLNIAASIGEPIKKVNVPKVKPVKPVVADALSNEARVISKEDYLAKNGASSLDFGEPGLHKTSARTSQKVRDRQVKLIIAKDNKIAELRKKLSAEYDAKVAIGELRPPTSTESLIEKAQGNELREDVQAARRILEKKGIDWKNGQTLDITRKKVTQNQLDTINREYDEYVQRMRSSSNYEPMSYERYMKFRGMENYELILSQPLSTTPKTKLSNNSLYRETSLKNFIEDVSGRNKYDPRYFHEDINLALGQGDNKGIIVKLNNKQNFIKSGSGSVGEKLVTNPDYNQVDSILVKKEILNNPRSRLQIRNLGFDIPKTSKELKYVDAGVTRKGEKYVELVKSSVSDTPKITPTSVEGVSSPETSGNRLRLQKQKNKLYQEISQPKIGQPQVSEPNPLTDLPSQKPIQNNQKSSLSFDKNNTTKINNDNIANPPTVRGGITPPELELGKWKDKGAFSLSRETLERNINAVAGSDAPKVKEFITDPIKANETARVEFLNNTRKEESNKIKELNIKLGSKDDKLVQQFGEGRITLDELKEKTNNWKNVQKASEYFRFKYDQLLNQINSVREKFGYDPIPKRADYFRHFQEVGNVIDQLGVIFKENDLPTGISGMTNIFKPGKPFTTAELRRMNGKFTDSAIGGMDNYLDAISKQIFHTDSVQRARALEKYIRITGDEGIAKLPNFVANLSEYANLLSGKKAQFDRAFESVFGRKWYGAVNWIKQQTGANMIGANISSAVMNFIPFTQSLATTSKGAAVRGLFESMITPLKRGGFNEIDGIKSSLLTRRYPTDKIARDLLGNVKEGANVLFSIIDKFTAKSIVAGKFYEGLQKGLSPQKAMKIADDYAANILADRSWGQLPNLMGSKTLGILTQFQTEVNNMYSNIVKDFPEMAKNKAGLISSIGQFVIYSYLFNSLYEKVMNRRPTIDPIYSGLTLAGQTDSSKNKSIGKRAIDAGKDIGGNLPFGNVFIEGGRFPISAGLPDVAGLIKGDTTLSKEIKKPLYYLAPPFGGGQAKKTIEGVKAYNQGASTTDTGKVRYTIDQNIPNKIRTTLFGQYSVPEAKNYFDQNQTPLSDKQSAKVLLESKGAYDAIRFKQQVKKDQNKIKKQLEKDGSGKAKAAEVDKWSIAYGYDTKGDFSQVKKLAKDENIPADIKKQLIENMGFDPDKAAQRLELEKGNANYNANYSYSQDKNKRSGDYQAWIKQAEDKVNRLTTYFSTLNPTSTEAVQTKNSIDDLKVQIDKYTSYKGFTKPKKAKKISVPKMSVSLPKIKSTKAPKIKQLKIKRTNVGRIKRPKIRKPKLD